MDVLNLLGNFHSIGRERICLFYTNDVVVVVLLQYYHLKDTPDMTYAIGTFVFERFRSFLFSYFSASDLECFDGKNNYYKKLVWDFLHSLLQQ